MNQLHIRLRNCIQTILELEPGIRKSDVRIFDSDFISLREFLVNLEKMQLVEADVERLENVTCHFLREIGRRANWAGNSNILQ